MYMKKRIVYDRKKIIFFLLFFRVLNNIGGNDGGERNMKKWKVIPVFIGLLLLFGCSNEAFDKHFAAGKSYLDKQDMKNAISELEKALIESPDDESAKLLLDTAKAKYYLDSIKNGDKAFESFDYEEAVKQYKIAVESDYKPSTEGSNDEDPKQEIRKKMEEAKGKIDSQKVLDSYVIWTKSQFDKVQPAVDTWRKTADNLTLSSATKATAIPASKAVFQKLRNDTDLSYSEVTSKTSTLEPDLAAVHQVMEDIFTNLHQNLIGTIKEIDLQMGTKKYELERVNSNATFVYDYPNAKAKFYERLKSYAQSQGLGLKMELLKNKPDSSVSVGPGEETEKPKEPVKEPEKKTEVKKEEKPNKK